MDEVVNHVPVPPLVQDEFAVNCFEDEDEEENNAAAGIHSVGGKQPPPLKSKSSTHRLCNNNNNNTRHYDNGSGTDSGDGGEGESDKNGVDVVGSASDSHLNTRCNDYDIKILVIGATNSGKTSLIEKYLSGQKSSEARTTLCIDIKRSKVPFEINGNTHHLTLIFYDMAGMKKFQSHNSSYYADVFAVLFVFDSTCKLSLNFTIDWLEDFCKFCKLRQMSPHEKILVCNKCDLPNCVMKKEELMNFGQNAGMTSVFEVSAKSGRNVNALFSYIAHQFIETKSNSS